MKKLLSLMLVALGVSIFSTVSARPTSLLEMVNTEIKPIAKQCTLDLTNGKSNCDLVKQIKVVESNKWGEMVLELDLAPVNGVAQKATFDINFEGEPDTWFKDSPKAWTVNIGDSITNNGRAGDGATQSNDSELHVTNQGLYVYASDYGNSELLYNQSEIFNVFNQTDDGYNLKFAIANNRVDYTNNDMFGTDTINSPYLFALEGQSDDEGEVNYDIYASFNRVIANNYRNGDGVASIMISIEEDVEPADLPDLIITDMDLAYGYGYGYKEVKAEDNKSKNGYGYGYGVVDQYEDFVWLRAMIRNIGVADSVPTQVQCYNSSNEVITTYRQTSMTSVIPSRNYAEYYLQLSSFGLSEIVSTPGMKTISCKVDSRENIDEEIEYNNVMSYNIYVVEVNTGVHCDDPMVELSCELGLDDCPTECMYVEFNTDAVPSQVALGQEDTLVTTFDVETMWVVYVDELEFDFVGLIDYTQFGTFYLYDDLDDVVGSCNLNNDAICLMDIVSVMNDQTTYELKTDIPMTVDQWDTFALNLIDATAMREGTMESIDVLWLPAFGTNIQIASTTDLPDLILTDIDLAYGYGRNIGIADSVPTQVQCYNMDNELITTTRGSSMTSAIPSMSSTEYYLQLSEYGLEDTVSTPGMKTISCKVDSRETIDEENENNNTMNYNIYVNEVTTYYSQEMIDAHARAYQNGFTAVEDIEDAGVYNLSNRAQAAFYMSKFATEFGDQIPNTGVVCDYADVSEGVRYYDEVVDVCQLGIMGVDPDGNPDLTFEPLEELTRGEFYIALSRSIRGDAHNGGNPEVDGHLQALLEADIVSSLLVNLDDYMTRWTVRLYLKRVDESGLLWVNCNEPMIQLACTLGLAECPVQCQTSCETPEIQLACALGLWAPDCPVRCQETAKEKPPIKIEVELKLDRAVPSLTTTTVESKEVKKVKSKALIEEVKSKKTKESLNLLIQDLMKK